MVSTTDQSPQSVPGRGRQLLLGLICMMMIANLQYSWTLFVAPMHVANGWSLVDIQWAFSIFIALETWFTPVAGFVVDRLGPARGPRVVVAVGGAMVAVAWVIDASATSLPMLYVGSAISGLGGGAVYATCVGNAVKWFPDRRGLAVGITAGGFGAGAALTVVPIKMAIASFGYASTFLWAGLLQGGALILIALWLQAPLPNTVPRAALRSVRQSLVNTAPVGMLRSPIFWLLYLMFVMISASGLMATAQIALIATDLNVANTVLLFGASTLGVALVIDNLMNGIARPFFGWVSDRIGREYTMVIAFSCGGLSYLLLGLNGDNPWLFVLFAGMIFFTWGEIFSLFPSVCTDTFGPRYATVNTSLLYTAKGTSALLIPLANLIKAATGGWYAVFLVAAATNLIVVLLAWFVLRPMRASRLARAVAATAAGPAVLRGA